jgi:hypothetical protein
MRQLFRYDTYLIEIHHQYLQIYEVSYLGRDRRDFVSGNRKSLECVALQ